MYRVFSTSTTYSAPIISDLTHTKEEALFIYFIMKSSDIPARIEKLNDKILG